VVVVVETGVVRAAGMEVDLVVVQEVDLVRVEEVMVGEAGTKEEEVVGDTVETEGSVEASTKEEVVVVGATTSALGTATVTVEDQ